MSLDDEYEIWLRNNALTLEKLDQFDRDISELRILPWISIITPVYNTDERWLRKAIVSVMRQIYPRWELCIADDASTDPKVREILAECASKDNRIKVKYLQRNEGIAGASNAALAMASGDFAGFLDHDDELTPDACFEVVRVINENPEVDYMYSDEDKLDENGRRVSVFFKPDWSPDTHLSMNYIPHFSVIRMSLLHEVGGLRKGFDGSQDYDLLLRITEKAHGIHHIPKPLYSWRMVSGSAAADPVAKPYTHDAGKRAIADALRRRQIQGEVEDGFFPNSYRVRYEIKGQPLVSILIPTRDKIDLLTRCLESVRRISSYPNYEIIIIDHQSKNRETHSYLRSLEDCRVIRFEGEFNYSRMNNFAAEHAKGEHLLFLNNDTEATSPNWIEAMLEHSQRPEVGAVGAKLVHPDGHVLHAGDVVGLGGIAGHAFCGIPNRSPGYFGLANIIRNCSCVTAACMMVRRNVFEELLGFDERLRIEYGDVDFCLRCGAKGYRVVYTPYAVLSHMEGGTRGVGKTNPPDAEESTRRWRQLLLDGDPYYSPNLDRMRPFRIRISQ